MRLSQKLIPIFIAVSFICLLFLLHIYSASMLNNYNNGGRFAPGEIDHVYMQAIINYHHDFSEFARRPLTTFFIQFLQQYLTISPGWSFIIVNFGFLFLSGLLIFRLSLEIGNSYRTSLLSLIIFYLSFSVLFAFFANIYTYDEPVQYFFILLAIWFCLRKNYWLWALTMFLALVARETTILLFPAFAWLWLKQSGLNYNLNKDKLLSAIKLLLPVLVYLGFIYWFITSRGLFEASQEYLTGSRLVEGRYNFQSWLYTKETLVNIFMVLAPGLFFTFFAWRHKLADDNIKFWLKLFILSALINTPIATLTSRVHEARVIALPMLFLWPVFGRLLFYYSQEMKLKLKLKSSWPRLPLFKILIFCLFSYLTYQLAFTWFIPMGGGGSGNRYQFYFWILLVFYGLHWFFKKIKLKLPV